MKWLSTLISRLRRPSPTHSILAIGLIGAVAGLVLWEGFHFSLRATSTDQFCTSCHEMTFPSEEMHGSIHTHNRSGVQATCADCHIPKEFMPKMWRKIEAAREVYAHFTMDLGTPEQWEAHRQSMAEREWARLEASDSQVCRNCHIQVLNQRSQQSAMAQEEHQEALDQGQTCIQCHKGIAHKLPADWGIEETDMSELEGSLM